MTKDHTDSARQAFGAIEAGRLPADLQATYALVQIDLLARDGRVDQAQALMSELLNRDPQPGAPGYRARVEAELCIATGRYACAIQKLATLDVEGEQRQEIHDVIWRYLGRAPSFQLSEFAARATGTEQGWWLLKLSMLESFTLRDQRARLDQWRTQWPQHPAATMPPTLLRRLETDLPRPQKVALLLPLTGSLQRAGRAVRDGFISGYLHATGGADSFQLLLFDTAAQPLPMIYESAMTAGVDLLVGPLTKDGVSALNDLNPQVPALGLNYLDAGSIPSENVYQLGLAIEDEADTMVTRLLADRARRLLVFHNDQDWSQRGMQRLVASWPYPATVQPLAEVKTVTEHVGRAMHVEQSQQRRDELASMLGTELEFLPRARDDLDAVVALVDAVEANALAPSLGFHFASELPVYASSQSVRGTEPQDRKELAGFHVSDLPWFLYDDPLHAEIDLAFGLRGNPFASLYALGVDAFRVSGRLPLLAESSLHQLRGSTGILSIQDSRRLARELAWGTVSTTGDLHPSHGSRTD